MITSVMCQKEDRIQRQQFSSGKRSFGQGKGVERHRKGFSSLTMDSGDKSSIPDGLAACEGPFCSVRFEPSGMKIKPKRYCCGECKMDAWALRRSAKLLTNLSDAEALKILRRASK